MAASPPDDQAPGVEAPAVGASGADALRWAGDEDERSLARPVRVATQPSSGGGSASVRGGTGALALVLFGVLAGIAALETVGWVQSAFGLVLGASLTTGSGTVLEVAAFVINLVFRVAGVAAPLVWFAVVSWRVPAGVRRLGWLAFGALLLVPWPLVVVP